MPAQFGHSAMCMWGHEAFNIYAPEQRLGYLVLDHIYDDYSDFVRIDSLFYFLASKGLTDASHVNNESDFFNDELLRNQLITVISNTNSENLDRFIESIIKKKPNYELITGKGGQKHEIGEFIIYGSGLAPLPPLPLMGMGPPPNGMLDGWGVG